MLKTDKFVVRLLSGAVAIVAGVVLVFGTCALSAGMIGLAVSTLDNSVGLGLVYIAVAILGGVGLLGWLLPRALGLMAQRMAAVENRLDAPEKRKNKTKGETGGHLADE